MPALAAAHRRGLCRPRSQRRARSCAAHGGPQAVQQGRGDGQAPVDYAHDQGHQVRALGGGVDGQGQLRALPSGQDPAQEGGETGVHIQLHPAGRGPVGPVMKPLAQILAAARIVSAPRIAVCEGVHGTFPNGYVQQGL